MGIRRLLLGVTSGLVIAGFAASSASATPLLPHLLGTSRFALPNFANPGFATPGFAAAASTAPEASLFLETDPVKIQVHGVTYVMGLSAYKPIGGPGSVDVVLSRAGASGSGQDYDYSLKPGGVGFTANLKTVRSAHLASGGSVAPSTIHLVYTATGPSYPGRCTLTDGTKKSFVAFTNGKVSVSSMSLATGNSFFGNLTAKPLTGSLGYDPGCRQGGGQVIYLCLGPAVLHTVSPTGENWDAVDIDGTSKAIEEEFGTSSVSSALTLSNDGGAVSHISNTLPNPTFTETGATVAFKTTGDPFMRGIGLFKSTQPPVVSKQHTCTDLKTFTNHTYVLHVYRGTLSPGKISPLRAIFDIGAIPLIAQPAQLYQVVYTS